MQYVTIKNYSSNLIQNPNNMNLLKDRHKVVVLTTTLFHYMHNSPHHYFLSAVLTSSLLVQSLNNQT